MDAKLKACRSRWRASTATSSATSSPSVRELYEEQDGRFVLIHDAIEGVKTQADLDRVNDTLRRAEGVRGRRAKLKRFDALGETDPDELLRLVDEVDSLRAQVGAGDAKREQAVQNRIARWRRRPTRSSASSTRSRARPRHTESAPTSWTAGSTAPPSEGPAPRRWRDPG